MHKTPTVRTGCRGQFAGGLRSLVPARVGTYFVTLSLADALPRDVLDWVAEQKLMRDCRQQREGTFVAAGTQTPSTLGEMLDDYLDAGAGACSLARPEIAEIVAAGLAYSDGCDYDLKAWCVMPNHVHVVFSMRSSQPPSSVVFAWKRFTAQKARRMLRGDGDFWRREYWQRPLENDRQIAAAVDYVAGDPARAGLASWPWSWSDRNSIDAVILPDFAAEADVSLLMGGSWGASSL